MKTIQLKNVPCGTTVQIIGDRFVVLDSTGGGILTLRRDIWKEAVLDEEIGNDLHIAGISEVLAEYRAVITKAAQEQGVCGGLCVKLLRHHQFLTYSRLIPKLDNPWWLEPPEKKIPGKKCGEVAYKWGGMSGGSRLDSVCYGVFGIRPAVIFDSSVAVFCETAEQVNS